ncbi:dTDP-4-dehydrorhamnose 3,5-epimerase [Tautonia sociabilis]|uniref:dTDP-4-dehydrorhamnose 3,5-epimerase n=1 Tax=Tautonia sociabilis TaxID=2080755 RepID=A0A432MET5_9BACT|nr:dTDP-4-dehydrorhamnose 3,5-epimerase [Tautonia sociabilis]RUL84190.1 dTDP-4-dehydrorhamnose 3,5-epimerase [Tautonia sociabilis]
MIFHPQELAGAFVIELQRFEDNRGFFARTWDPEAFASHGLNPRLAQCSVAYNRIAGTVRGMHWQDAPHEEAKLVRVTAGAIFDVIIDLRPSSPTYTKWLGVELAAGDGRMLYVPEGFAHGYITLADGTEVTYGISAAYAPEAARGVRWDDPAFGVRWPREVVCISDRDRTYPDFTP